MVNGMKEIYLDNSATTRVFDEVADLMVKVMTEDYGNPSSLHLKGVEAERYIKGSKATIAKALKVDDKDIIFTSCGTESDNMAIMGAAYANKRKGNHLITTKIEHPAVLRTMEKLSEEGFKITYLGTDSSGRISLDELKSQITDATILVSIMHVNNEIGSVQPIEEAAKLVKSINKEIIFHVDAVQSFGKLKIHPKKMNIDLLSVSGHKIHGPKGIGFLYVNSKIKINPIIFGGGQQNGMRSGTESVPSIAAIGLATELVYKNLEEDVKRLYELKYYFIKEATKIEGVTINGIPLNIEDINEYNEASLGAPHVISVSVKDVRAEVILHALEDKGIYVSAGSACSTHKRAASQTLLSIGLEKPLLESTVRFSTSIFTTKDELDEALKAMNEIIPNLRKYVRH